MDFFSQAQKLADTARDTVQEAANNTASSIDEMVDEVNSATASFATSGMVIANALKDLPMTAEELAKEMPKIAYRLRYRAGLQVGDSPRSDTDVMKLFEKIPGASKLEAIETKIRQFLADKHGSHAIPRQYKGTNAADNIFWEVGTDNLRRGAKVMTDGEKIYIRVYNAVDSIVKNSTTIAKLGVVATGTAILTQAVMTALSYSLDLYRGDITIEEYKDLILQEAVRAGITTPIFFIIFVAVLALFPGRLPAQSGTKGDRLLSCKRAEMLTRHSKINQRLKSLQHILSRLMLVASRANYHIICSGCCCKL